jgi:ubiquinone/menaquinone biosynthesis C-methylase UbiE
MENDGESERLERKTDVRTVQQQALWAGLKPGMRVADIACGSGKPAYALFQAVQPGGRVVGVDGSDNRIDHAVCHYGAPGLEFVRRDLIRDDLTDLGLFDFMWIRFFLEYHRSNAFELVKKFAASLKPGGILCLIDLDHNSMNHYEMPPKVEQVMRSIMAKAEQEDNFDSRMGIKLYSFLYDLGFEEIAVTIGAHHLIFGALNEVDAFNWSQKLEVAVQRSKGSFDAFDGDSNEFKEVFQRFFSDHRRFSYTPYIACRGCKPA